jgi:FMN phosphatase YigB (HAD superfamily)
MYLFNDCEELLMYLKEHHYEIIMLTKGDKDFQFAKIDNTNIEDYFDNIIVTNKHKGDLDIDYNAVFVDDNIEELESIMKNNPLKVVHIDRYREKNNKDKRFLTIHSLKELLEIISN